MDAVSSALGSPDGSKSPAAQRARPNRPSGVTIYEVAAAAGVSISTVSKALRDGYSVRPETREHIRSVARRLNFSPNPQAQSLHSGRTRTVGIITSDLDGRFAIPIMTGAEDALHQGDVAVFLSDARGQPEREQRLLRHLIARRIDGLLIVGDDTPPRDSFGEVGVPVVYAYAPSKDPADISVASDDVTGGRIAAQHLLDCGYRRIACITGPEGHLSADNRIAGADAALHERGLPPLADRALRGEWDERWGREGFERALEHTPDLDAIMCGSDYIARGVLDAAHSRGLEVPGDLAIIGYDNWMILTAQSQPPLTTVDMNLHSAGEAAARLLFDAVDGRPEPGTHVITPTLVVRQSTTH